MKKINIFFLFVLFTIVISLNASAVFAGTVTLSWDAPTTNVDGAPLTDLAGYEVHYGTASGNYSQHINVGNVTTYTVNNLTDGTYYATVTAYDTSGNESGYSNEVSMTIQSPQQNTLTVNKGGTGSGIVTSFPAGINCGYDCSEAYNAGTVVTLTALPNTGSIFTGWSGGGCTGTGMCSFSINSAMLVTANFTPIATTTSITVNSPNGGEKWRAGTTQTIRWNYTGSPGSRVKINLLKNGVFNSTIISGTSIGSNGNGSYSWKIPQRFRGTNYKISVISTTNTIYQDSSDNNLTINR